MCTQIGCTDGLAITLDAQAWPHGDYVFRVQADDTTVTCRGALPLPTCGTAAIRCDSLGVSIGESGCALPPAEHGFGEMHIDGHPARVEVAVEFAGKTAVTYASEPVFQTVRPNGPECEPTCRHAAITMKIPTLRRKPAAAKPEPKPDRVQSTTACLAAPPSTPPGLSAAARACLEGLVAARDRFGFVDPPAPMTPPCAVDEIDEDGVVIRRGQVTRVDPRRREVVFDFVDDAGQRTVVTDTRVRDVQGRETSVVRLWDDYLEGDAEPDCSNPTTTKHARNRKGWPTKTTKVIETCEGVDAGTITTRRTFKAEIDFVSSAMKIVDRGTPLRASGWWLPDPADPVAYGSTDAYDETSCSLHVIDCDGTELGRLDGGNGIKATRNRFRCDADTVLNEAGRAMH